MNLIDIKSLKIEFYKEFSEMPISSLKTEITDDIQNNYAISVLDIDDVINHIHDGNAYKTFTIDAKMEALLKFISEGNKLIPPIIRNITNDSWTVFDGQHRIALFIHLEIAAVPFLIRKDQVKYLETLKQK